MNRFLIFILIDLIVSLAGFAVDLNEVNLSKAYIEEDFICGRGLNSNDKFTLNQLLKSNISTQNVAEYLDDLAIEIQPHFVEKIELSSNDQNVDQMNQLLKRMLIFEKIRRNDFNINYYKIQNRNISSLDEFEDIYNDSMWITHICSEISKNIFGPLDWIEGAKYYFDIQILIRAWPKLDDESYEEFELWKDIMKLSNNSDDIKNILNHLYDWPLKKFINFGTTKKALNFLLSFMGIKQKALELIINGPSDDLLSRHVRDITTYILEDFSELNIKEELELIFNGSNSFWFKKLIDNIYVGEELTFVEPKKVVKLNNYNFKFISANDRRYHPFIFDKTFIGQNNFQAFVDHKAYEVTFAPYFSNDEQMYEWIKTIFNRAKELGLKPHHTVGGGHKHLDLERSFYNSPLLFMRFFLDMNRDGLFLARVLGRDKKSSIESFVFFWQEIPSELLLSLETRLFCIHGWLSEYPFIRQKHQLKNFAHFINKLIYMPTAQYIHSLKNAAINLDHVDSIGTIELRFPGPARDADTVRLLNDMLLAHINYLKQQIDNREEYNITSFNSLPAELTAHEAIEMFKAYLKRLGLDYSEYKYLINPSLLRELRKENKVSLSSQE